LPLAALRPAEGSEIRALREVEDAAADPEHLDSSLDLRTSSFGSEDVAAAAEENATSQGAPTSHRNGAAGGADAATHPSNAVSERNAELAMRVGDYTMAAEIYAKIVADPR